MSPKNFFINILTKIISKKYGVLLFYSDPERASLMSRIDQVMREVGMLLGYNEAFNILSLANSTLDLPGNWAEVGVYTGGSAKLLSEHKGNKKLYLYDTFEGIPSVGREDPGFFQGQYPASYEAVKKYVPNAEIIKGLFPQTAIDDTFAFVHLDVDTYQSTLDCLKYFFPRMSKGGIILSHDFHTGSGVVKAFREFFSDKPEKYIPIDTNQCFVIKH